MNRTEKIALLTKVIQGDAPATRLQQAIDNAPRSLIIIDDLDLETGKVMTDNDPVHFRNKGKDYAMTLGDAYQYARQHQIRMLFILPVKR